MLVKSMLKMTWLLELLRVVSPYFFVQDERDCSLTYAVSFGNEGLLALVEPDGSHVWPREFLAAAAAFHPQLGNGSVRRSSESHALIMHRTHTFSPMIPCTTFDCAFRLTRSFGAINCVASTTQAFGDRRLSTIGSGTDFISLGFFTGLIIHGGGKI